MTERKFFSEKHRTMVLWAMEFHLVTSPEFPSGCTLEKTDWPFVPRVGDHLELDCEEHKVTHHGTIRNIGWDDHGQPQVIYR